MTSSRASSKAAPAPSEARELLLARPEVVDAIRKSVESAPPLTAEQVALLRAAGLGDVFRSSSEKGAA